ncbi:hypothetical protein GCM10007301_51820 [Azorhizobium oxalatiphilum]|uniref:Tyr recombinase domain-containing protein n=2 Tax=Azorhizobium oxalatiphilum TaxID=980631 RepID=A0A917CFY8_9HYPH|nr:hypothetical protein GCM10007301_51820 [Azorhizobium oxalatiphilum]
MNAVGIFYDYLVQRADHLAQHALSSSLPMHTIALQEFVNHLIFGTITDWPAGSTDPTGLFWAPAGSGVVSSIVSSLNDVIIETEKYGFAPQHPPQWGPWTARKGSEPTGIDAVRLASAARKASENNSLSYYLPRKAEIISPSARLITPTASIRLTEETKSFPAPVVRTFLEEGFQTRRAENHAASLAAILMFGGGMRVSEPLHIWVEDISVGQGRVKVLVRHPQTFEIRKGRHLISRDEYLRRHSSDLRARNKISGPLHAGWKGMLMNKKHECLLHWLPVFGLEELFLERLTIYLSEIRPALMERRLSRGMSDHPFLLVSAGDSHTETDSSAGDPYSLKSLRKAWQEAVWRLSARYPDLNLIHDKDAGTTAHGARHFYGKTLKALRAPREVIRVCMRHKSPHSQDVYTEPSWSEVHALIDGPIRRTALRNPDLIPTIA